MNQVVRFNSTPSEETMTRATSSRATLLCDPVCGVTTPGGRAWPRCWTNYDQSASRKVSGGASRLHSLFGKHARIPQQIKEPQL